MRYEEIGEQDHWVLWTIPGARRKSGQTHVIPLSSLALEVIGEWKRRRGAVFVGTQDTAITTRALAYGLRRNIGEPELAPPKKHGLRKRKPLKMDSFSPHDLRRTAATLMSNAGVAGLVKPMLLGHRPLGITQTVYDRYAYFRPPYIAVGERAS